MILFIKTIYDNSVIEIVIYLLISLNIYKIFNAVYIISVQLISVHGLLEFLLERNENIL